jgi:hypothetical protein
LKKRVVMMLAFAFAELSSKRAHAEPTAQERALAESLFRDAKALVTAGNVAAACPKFAESQRLDPQVGTLLYLATCHQQEGKTASAWVEFNDAASAAHAAAQPDREAIAHTRAAALEAKLARLTVSVRRPSDGETLTVDGIPLGKSAWGASFPVDPGTHVVKAQAAGHAEFSRTVTAEPAGTSAVDVPQLEAVAAPPPRETPKAEPTDGASGDGRRTMGFVALGVGGAGLVVGSVFGLIAIGDKNDAAKLGDAGGCVGNRCVKPVLDKENDARTMGWASTAGFAVGIAAAGAGAYLLFTSSSKEPSNKEPAKAAWLVPRVGPREAGLGGGFSF